MEAFSHLLNALLMLAMPLALAVFLLRRFRLGWRLLGVGALTFLISQVLHIPFNQWLLTPLLQRLSLSASGNLAQLVAWGVLLGLSAGLFEESARYLVLRFWQRQARTWPAALLFGAGHGGMEAILLGLLALLTFFQMLALRGADLSALLPPAQLELAQAQVTAYWSMPWQMALLGALERLWALCLHLSLAVLVLQAITRRNLLWLAIAVLWHTLTNAAALVCLQLWGAYAAEGILAPFAAASLAIVFLLRGKDGPPEAQEPSSISPGPLHAPPNRAALDSRRRERLNDSRYSE
jgi:uncharacterized membrane protein YhfC